MNRHLLFPEPHQLREIGLPRRLPPVLRLKLNASGDLEVARRRVERALRARGHRLVPWQPGEAPADIELSVMASGLGREHYRLSTAEGRAHVASGDGAGLYYGACTLGQLLESASGAPGCLELPSLDIEDGPDYPVRGVMLDVSRDKVPSLATLRDIIDHLASLKVNQLQLYMEHAFAYAGHEAVWREASPLTPSDVRELDAHARERHIELVPNQNSFGHMQRWLRHEPYRQLAECPEGFEHPWNWSGEPYGLCATDPRALSFLEGLYDQLLPHFQSRSFNVGLDETLDLGHGRSKAECQARGTERVYLEFLKAVHARVTARGRVMQFWGDIILRRPELIAELPKDALALAWGYEADHPFAEQLAHFARAGLSFYVCPGTSSWNSLAGRTENAITNLARAAQHGQLAGAAGYLITDWGDHGHLQPFSVSCLGLLLGAGFGWNVASAARAPELDVPALLDRHAFGDAAGVLGGAAYELGQAYLHAGSLRQNASVLFWMLIKPERVFSPAGVTRQSLLRTLEHVEAASLAGARPERLGAGLITSELAWVKDMLGFACRLGIARCDSGQGSVGVVPRSRRLELASELSSLVEGHRALWLARNRPGGLRDSAARLEALVAALRA